MYAYYQPQTIKNFYARMLNANFSNLSQFRAEEIDKEVEKQRYFFTTHSVGVKTLMSFTAEKLTTSPKRFGLTSPEEIVYFYVKMVDPKFLFLEAYEANCKVEGIKDTCKTEFHIYDGYMIAFEKAINDQLGLFDVDDLWSRGSFGR